MVAARDWWVKRVVDIVKEPMDMTLKQKIFVPKFPGIPKVGCYKRIEDKGFWEAFPQNLKCPADPGVDWRALKGLCDAMGVDMDQKTKRVIGWVRDGARIGCEGRFRSASSSSNAKGAYECGPQVTDAIAAWISQGYAFGPVDEGEVPAGAKINGILTRQKPNGSVRIILNLSAPKGMSVNDGIDVEQFPAKMSSTEQWLRVLNRAGRGCWLTKTDWADAYKHVTVALEDTDLQWFEWGGKFFKELCLIFGCSSSAGIFDALAKLVLELVCRMVGFPREMVCQHLDDICAAMAAAELRKLEEFDEGFKSVAGMVGVKLAPRTDKEKSFGPCKQGVVFGVEYDTENWTWAIPRERMVRLLLSLQEAMDRLVLEARAVKSLAGKIINVKALVPMGRFNVDLIMRWLVAAAAAAADKELVAAPEGCGRQLQFWHVMLRACSGVVSIPGMEPGGLGGALEAFTDAAGGSADSPGNGTGGVMGDWWFYVPWSVRVRAGGWRVDGMKVSRKLSALELVGPLAVVAAGVGLVRNRRLIIWVDNAGSVAIWRKGYSNRCMLCTTLVAAIAAVAAAVGCRVELRKVARCSDVGSRLADHLSKGNFGECRQLARQCGWPLAVEPARLPVALVRWIDRPEPDRELGQRILEELARGQPILSYSL